MNRTLIAIPLLAAALLTGCGNTGAGLPDATATQPAGEVSAPIVAEKTTATAKVGEVIAVPVADPATAVLVSSDPALLTVLGQGYTDGEIEKTTLQAQAQNVGTVKLELNEGGKVTKTITVTITR